MLKICVAASETNNLPIMSVLALVHSTCQHQSETVVAALAEGVHQPFAKLVPTLAQCGLSGSFSGLSDCIKAVQRRWIEGNQDDNVVVSGAWHTMCELLKRAMSHTPAGAESDPVVLHLRYLCDLPMQLLLLDSFDAYIDQWMCMVEAVTRGNDTQLTVALRYCMKMTSVRDARVAKALIARGIVPQCAHAGG